MPTAFHLAILSLHVFRIPLLLCGASVPLGLMILQNVELSMELSSSTARGSRFTSMLTWPSSLRE